MPQRIEAARADVDRQAERLAVSELILDLVYTPDNPDLLDDIHLKVVIHAILVGTLRGKPLNQSGIARLVSMKRDAVRRHADKLISLGMVERYGNVYLLARAGATRASPRLDDWAAAIMRAADKLRAAQNAQVTGGRTVP